MKLRDKYGFPILRLKGRPLRSLLRLFSVNLRATWRMRSMGNVMCPVCGAYVMSTKEHLACPGKPPHLDGFIVDGWPKRELREKRKQREKTKQALAKLQKKPDLEKVLGVDLVVDDTI